MPTPYKRNQNFHAHINANRLCHTFFKKTTNTKANTKTQIQKKPSLTLLSAAAVAARGNTLQSVSTGEPCPHRPVGNYIKKPQQQQSASDCLFIFRQISGKFISEKTTRSQKTENKSFILTVNDLEVDFKWSEIIRDEVLLPRRVHGRLASAVQVIQL